MTGDCRRKSCRRQHRWTPWTAKGNSCSAASVPLFRWATFFLHVQPEIIEYDQRMQIVKQGGIEMQLEARVRYSLRGAKDSEVSVMLSEDERLYTIACRIF